MTLSSPVGISIYALDEYGMKNTDKKVFFYKYQRNISFLIGSIIIVLIMGCTITFENSPEPASTPAIPTNEWLLDDTSFPPTWSVNPCAPHCERTERVTQSLRSFGNIDKPGHVIQNVFYFSSEKAAEAKFQRYEERTSHLAPPEITYRSPIADEQYLQCGIDEPVGIYVCRASRRYGTYFIYFFFNIDQGDGNGLQLREVETILRAMDEQAAIVLNIP